MDLHHGVHELQPPGTAALLGPSREPEPAGKGWGPAVGGEAAASLSLAEEGGAAQTRPGRGVLPRGGRPWHLLSLTVCGTLDLFVTLENKTAEFGTGPVSPIRKLSSLYQEERKSLIFLFSNHYSGPI